MSALLPGLVIAPIVLPIIAAALLLLVNERRRRLRMAINLAATFTGLGVAVALLAAIGAGGPAEQVGVYLASNWQAPFGIVLVADRLSVMMLVLVGVVSSAAALYAEAGWSRAGAYFHPLFQIQLLGLNGAFLTGDLFNLFVFFEVLLAASYGLQLHGVGWRRVRSGMHYIAINLVASSLFLIGLAVLYGVMGTLSMADLADKVGQLADAERGLFHVGATILAMAFLIKAAIWPLNHWLVSAYTASSVAVACLFVLMTKVGFYAILRLWTLNFSADAGISADFGSPVLLAGGLVTLAVGSIGMMASIRLERIAAHSVLISAGTLLTALGINLPALTSAALFYLVSATLAAGALFLLVELAKRTSVEGQAQPPDVEQAADEDDNLDDEEVPLVGRAFPVSVALLGLAFLACALMVAGLPPLSGFLAKLALLSAAAQAATEQGAVAWLMIVLLLLSGLFATVSLVRAGIRHFWSKGGRFAPRLKAAEAGSVLWLIAAGMLLTVMAEPALRFTAATASYLHTPRSYIEAVLGARPKPGPVTPAPGDGAAP